MGKHLCYNLFLIKLQVYNFIKNRLQRKCFPVTIAKFLRTAFLKNSSGGYFCGFTKPDKHLGPINYH